MQSIGSSIFIAMHKGCNSHMGAGAAAFKVMHTFNATVSGNPWADIWWWVFNTHHR
ncbi:hypothetical protein AA11825_0665 [Acetobacter pomorum DSM 11825]|nr:hypothetical protein AA11825_0665 [Acetobacter pomorum DSM 11825]